MAGSMLITRPENDDATIYLSKWSENIIKEAKNKGLKVIDLWRNKANRERVIGILGKVNPRFVMFNGHGSENCVRGHNMEIIIEEGDGKEFDSKIIFSRSCKSAKILGQTTITEGAIAYLGYKEDFWFKYNPKKVFRPLEDKTAELFLEPSNYLGIALLKGHTTGLSNNKSKGHFRKNMEKLLIEGPLAEDYDCIRYLYWDMIHQVCLGNQDAVL